MSHLQEYDCKAERTHDLSIEFYKPNGKLQRQQAGGWTNPVPGSNAAATLRTVCDTITIRDPKYILGDREPFAAMRAFLDQSPAGS
jgi:hypothetical protein